MNRSNKMSFCNFKHLITVTILIGMASVQSLPVQQMARSSSPASSANDPPIVIAKKILRNLTNTSTESRGLLPVWGNAIDLAEEDILKAQVSCLISCIVVRACIYRHLNQHCSINVGNRKCAEVECSTSMLIRILVRAVVMPT